MLNAMFYIAACARKQADSGIFNIQEQGYRLPRWAMTGLDGRCTFQSSYRVHLRLAAHSFGQQFCARL